MSELLYYKRNPLIMTVVDGSIKKKNIYEDCNLREALKEDTIFAQVFQ